MNYEFAVLITINVLRNIVCIMIEYVWFCYYFMVRRCLICVAYSLSVFGVVDGFTLWVCVCEVFGGCLTSVVIWLVIVLCLFGRVVCCFEVSVG